MEIKTTNNISEFKLNLKLYDYSAIIETAKEFTESCWISLNYYDKDSMIIKIEPKNKTDLVEDAIGYFFNYMIGIMNRKIKGFEIN